MQANQLVTSKPDKHPIGPKPLLVKDGSVSVKIYGTWVDSKRTDPATGYALKHYLPQYAVRYYLGGKRQNKKFSDLNKAKRHGSGANLVYLDGHAGYLDGKRIVIDLFREHKP